MAKQPESAAAETPKKGKKLILIVGVLVLALGGGGAGAWYLMRSGDTNAGAAEVEKPAQFLPLESFTVNLQAPEGQSQYLQAGLTLKFAHTVKMDAVKERMPEIRNRMLLVLSGKKATELLPVSGKQKLASELSDTVRDVLGDSAGLMSAKKLAKAKAKAEAEEADEENEEAEETKAKPKRKAAAQVARNDVEVLFTSFIIQ